MSALQAAWQTFWERSHFMLKASPKDDIEHAYAMGWHAGRIDLRQEQIAEMSKDARAIVARIMGQIE